MSRKSSATVVGSANLYGLLVNVVDTATPGTLLDAADSTQFGDEGFITNPPLNVVTIIAINTDLVDHSLNIQAGGATVANQWGPTTVPAGVGPVVIMDRELIGHGQELRAWADAAGFINVKLTKWPYSG